jgi:hypothetical protein
MKTPKEWSRYCIETYGYGVSHDFIKTILNECEVAAKSAMDALRLTHKIEKGKLEDLVKQTKKKAMWDGVYTGIVMGVCLGLLLTGISWYIFYQHLDWHNRVFHPQPKIEHVTEHRTTSTNTTDSSERRQEDGGGFYPGFSQYDWLP